MRSPSWEKARCALWCAQAVAPLSPQRQEGNEVAVDWHGRFLYVIKFAYTQVTPCASSLEPIQQCSPRERVAKVPNSCLNDSVTAQHLTVNVQNMKAMAVLPLAAAGPPILPIEIRWWEGILQFR